MCQLDLPYAAEDDSEQQYQQQLRRRLAVLQLLQLALNDSTAAPGVAAAAHALVQSPESAAQAVSAAVGLLWLQHDMQLPLGPVLQLMTNMTGAAAPQSVLEAVAAYSKCSAVRLLQQLHLTAAAAALHQDDDFAPAQFQGSYTDRSAILLLLVRLLPHVPDPALAAAAVHCCLFSASSSMLPDLSGSQHGLSQQLDHDQPANAACILATCNLQLKEQRVVLQLLHNIDAAAGPSSELPGGYLRVYFTDLFAELARQLEPAAAANEAAAAAAPAGATLQLSQLAAILSALGSWHVQTGSRQGAGLPAAVKAELAAAHLHSLAALLAAGEGISSAAAACLMRLLPGFSEDEVQQVLAHSELSSSRQAAASSNAVVFFFSEQQAVQRSKQRTCAEDFTKLSTLLETHIQKAKAAAASSSSSSLSGQQLRLPAIDVSSAAASAGLIHGSSSSSSSEGNAAGLVLTETTIENISRVLDVVDNPAPLLLEGPTGVGKSATVAEAARRHGKRLLRFNMSSSITPDDLMGRVVMKAAPSGSADSSSAAAVPGEGFVFQHQLQPFAAAFVEGNWLLLDELNLAPDDVLQCIEQALDTGVSSSTGCCMLL
jgi:hypothetical protein